MCERDEFVRNSVKQLFEAVGLLAIDPLNALMRPPSTSLLISASAIPVFTIPVVELAHTLEAVDQADCDVYDAEVNTKDRDVRGIAFFGIMSLHSRFCPHVQVESALGLGVMKRCAV
jgi:hypothetical protein